MCVDLTREEQKRKKSNPERCSARKESAEKSVSIGERRETINGARADKELRA
jgi:hypothetical protein